MADYIELICIEGPVPGKRLKYRADGEAQRALRAGHARYPDDEPEPETEPEPEYEYDDDASEEYTEGDE